MDSLDIIIILICQTILQIIGFFRHHATIRKRFERLETSKDTGSGDDLAREIHTLVNELSNKFNSQFIRRENSRSDESEERKSRNSSEEKKTEPETEKEINQTRKRNLN